MPRAQTERPSSDGSVAANSGSRGRKVVLVVEDDASLLATLRYNLSSEGYEVLTARDGEEGLALARSHSPDAIVLDLMLPTMGGFDVCRALRRDGDIVPILMLTARDAEIDRIVGLEVGADDYVTKPFSLRELQARVSAMLRRVEMDRTAPVNGAPDPLEFGPLVINTAAHETTLDGEVVRLRRREFDLLAFLARNEGQAFSREQLLQHVWGYDYVGDTRTVDVHVRWLRQKIEKDPSDPRRILTVRGVGYRFAG